MGRASWPILLPCAECLGTFGSSVGCDARVVPVALVRFTLWVDVGKPFGGYRGSSAPSDLGPPRASFFPCQPGEPAL